MLKGGLKVKLALLLAVLLLIGVAVSNLVTLLFHHRELVRLEVAHIQRVVDGWYNEEKSLTHTFEKNLLQEFCADTENWCVYAGSYSSSDCLVSLHGW